MAEQPEDKEARITLPISASSALLAMGFGLWWAWTDSFYLASPGASPSATSMIPSERCFISLAALPRVAVENRRQLGRTITYCSSRPRCRCCGQRLGILARRHPTFCEIRCTSTCLTPCLSCRLCKNEANFLWQQTLCPNHCERACPPRRNSLDLARRIASIRV